MADNTYIVKHPTKLSKELTERVCSWIRKGNILTVACTLGGINYTTFVHYMRAGEEDPEGECREFYLAVKQAEADHQAHVVAQWEKVNTKTRDWRSFQAMLSYRHGWAAPVQKTETSVQVQVTSGPDLTHLSTIQVEEYLKLKEAETRLLNPASAKLTTIDVPFCEVEGTVCEVVKDAAPAQNLDPNVSSFAVEHQSCKHGCYCNAHSWLFQTLQRLRESRAIVHGHSGGFGAGGLI